MADVLEQVAGVRVRRFGGLGSYSTVQVRGAKAEQVLVLLDGVRLNSAQRGSVDLSTLSLRSVDRIEVVRGAGSARYGSDAVGGVVSITSRRRDADDVVDAALRAGSLETLGADLYVSRGDGSGQTTLGYARLSSDNDFRFDRPPPALFAGLLPTTRHTRLNAEFAEDTGLANASRSLPGGSELGGTVQLFGRRNGQPGSTVGKLVGAPDEALGCLDSDESYARGVGSLSWSEPAFGEGALELSLGHRYERGALDDPDFCLTSPSLGLDSHTQWIENASRAELVWAGRARRAGPVTLLTRAALTGRFDQVRSSGSESKHRAWGNGFVQQELRLFGGSLRIVPALGLELADTSSGLTRVAGFSAPVEVDVDEDPAWLPRIGLIWRIAPGLRFKANWLRAYRRPNFRELFHPDYGFLRGNPELEAEDGVNFDAGFELARHSLGALSDLRLEAVWFQRDIEESIEWMLVGSTSLPVNTGEARARGVELSGSAALLERLRLRASYTFLDSEIRASGVPLPHSPRNRLFLRGDLSLGATTLFAEWSYEDEQTLVASPFAERVPEVRELDLGVVLRPARLPGLAALPAGLSVSSEWLNVTGEERVDSLGLPLPGQALWFLTVRGEFR